MDLNSCKAVVITCTHLKLKSHTEQFTKDVGVLGLSPISKAILKDGFNANAVHKTSPHNDLLK